MEEHTLVVWREDPEDGFSWRCSCGETGVDPDGHFEGVNPCPEAPQA